MTIITRITTQKKHNHRYNIFLDDGSGEKYGFSVDEDVLIEFNLRKSLELEESMIRRLVEQDSIHKSYSQVIGYLGYRMRTKKEIHDYLLKKEVDPEHIAQIIAKLIDQNLLDDEQFAQMFVRSRIQTSTKGPELVKKELINKGVSSEISNEAVQQYHYEVMYEKACKIATKRMRQQNKHSFQKQIQQLQAALMRNGFTQEVVKDIVEVFQEHKDLKSEWTALEHQGEKLYRKHQARHTGCDLQQKVKEGLYRQGFSIGSIDQFLDQEQDHNDKDNRPSY